LNIEELPDSGLITLVQGNDPGSRARAIELLGQRKATAAVQPLIEALEDGSLRPAIAGALARMKAEATPVLIRLLKSPDPRHRKHAAFIFGEFRSAAVVKSLIPLLGDLSRDVHTAAFEALGKTGEGALGDLRGAIRDPDPNVRIGIANALGRMAAPGPSGQETPVSLEDLLEDEGVPGGPGDGPGGDGWSGHADRGDGERPAETGHPALSMENRELVVSLLKQLLDDENPHVRDAASAALHRAGGSSAQTVPGGIDSSDPRARKHAIQALGQSLLFRETGAAIPPLIEALFDEDPEIRFLAAKGLRYSKDPRTVTPLNACLLDVSPDVRLEAVEGLRRRKDPRVLDPLVHALQDELPGVRRAAAGALGELGDEGARDALLQCGHDGDHLVRDAAARSLVMLGPDPRLDPRILVRSPDPELRSEAVAGLGAGKDKNDLGLITASLGDEDARVRSAAAEALCGFSDPAAVPVLLGALSDTDADVRMYALRALQGTDDPRVLVPLIYSLKDSHAPVRTEAVSHLRKIGDDEAVPYLIEALGDPDAGVCEEAVLLLGNIGGERTAATLRDLELKTHDPLKLAAVRTALDQIARMNKAGSGSPGEEAGGDAPDRTAPGQVSRVNRPGAGARGEPPEGGAAARTALDQVSRINKPDRGTPGEQPAGKAAGRTAPGQVSRMHKPGSVTRDEQSGAGAADRVVISRKKDVEPAPPHTLMVTPRNNTEAPAGDFSECPVLWENDPHAARVWQNLLDNAGDFLEKEEFAAAKPLLEKAWEICPDSELLVTRLGITLSSLGRYEEALSVYKKGLALNPRNDAFWSNAGALLANLERYDEALRSYKKALALCMSDEQVWYQTGIVLNNLGRYPEAVKCFDRALLLNPEFPEAVEARRIARGNVWG
jgi:HEAT repeat protein